MLVLSKAFSKRKYSLGLLISIIFLISIAFVDSFRCCLFSCHLPCIIVRVHVHEHSDPATSHGRSYQPQLPATSHGRPRRQGCGVPGASFKVLVLVVRPCRVRCEVERGCTLTQSGSPRFSLSLSLRHPDPHPRTPPPTAAGAACRLSPGHTPGHIAVTCRTERTPARVGA